MANVISMLKTRAVGGAADESNRSPLLRTMAGRFGTKASGAADRQDATGRVSIVASSSQVGQARGRIILVGPEVSASLEPAVADQRWIFQAPRELRKWQPLQPKASQFLNISIHQKMADALRKHRLKDIRIGYDGYRSWLLGRPTDTVLLAGVRRADGLWLTEIAYINANIVSVRERRIDATSDVDIRFQIQTAISEARSATPRAGIVLAIEGMQADPAWKVESVGIQPLLCAPATSLKLGFASINLKLATPPLLVAAAALAYCGYTLYEGNRQMESLGKQYRTAVSGIENEYKEGMKLINLLEARNVYMGERERMTSLKGRAAQVLKALPVIDTPLLDKMSILRDKEGNLTFELIVNVIPDKQIDPIAQAEPYVRGLAAGLNTDVSLSDYNDVVISSISNRLKFRQMRFTGSLPKDGVTQ